MYITNWVCLSCDSVSAVTCQYLNQILFVPLKAPPATYSHTNNAQCTELKWYNSRVSRWRICREQPKVFVFLLKHYQRLGLVSAMALGITISMSKMVTVNGALKACKSIVPILLKGSLNPSTWRAFQFLSSTCFFFAFSFSWYCGIFPGVINITNDGNHRCQTIIIIITVARMNSVQTVAFQYNQKTLYLR